MKIRTRLVLRFTLIVASILTLFAITVYYFSSSHRKQDFYSRLKDKAITITKLYSKDVEEVSPQLLKIIEKNSLNLLPDEKIAIYNYKNVLVFNSPDTDSSANRASADLLNRIRDQKEIQYKEKKHEVIGFLFEGQFDKYVVIASALDQSGFGNLIFLKYILIIGVIGTICITIIAGFFFSKQVLFPISKVVDEVDKITASNLNKRVNVGNGADEIANLAVTFNRMLDRIEKAFDFQKNFISNASHEFRTPLTSITGQLEVALINKRSPEEYQAIISSALEDINSLNKLTNGLLDLAHANMDASNLHLKEVRIDELLWQARNELLKRKPSYKINIEILDFPTEEEGLIVFGSEQLLKTAILNLMDNGCKFSPDEQVFISFNIKDNQVWLIFIDRGIGISDEDLKKTFHPFHRGSNAKLFPGHGVGLSFTRKIIELHRGTITIESHVNEFTKVSISLPVYV